MTDFPRQKDAIAFYGNPAGDNGQPSLTWERENLVLVAVPWRIFTSWDKKEMRGIRLHRKCAQSFIKIAKAIWEFSEESQMLIAHYGLDLCGGGYNFRLTRGGSILSMHSFGAAIDFDPERNGFGKKNPRLGEFPRIIDFFEREGWEWGGRWKKKDGMHFQAASTK